MTTCNKPNETCVYRIADVCASDSLPDDKPCLGDDIDVLIYAKNGKYRCHGPGNGCQRTIAQGYEHTGTINAADWLQRFLNAGKKDRTEMVWGLE